MEQLSVMAVISVLVNAIFAAYDFYKYRESARTGNYLQATVYGAAFGADMILIFLPLVGSIGPGFRLVHAGAAQLAITSAESTATAATAVNALIHTILIATSRSGSGTGNWRTYEAQIRGPHDKARVNGVEFDGVPGDLEGPLLDAKYVPSGEKSWYFIPKILRRSFDAVRQKIILNQAERQVKAAGDRTIRWYVSDAKVADSLKTLFEQKGLLVKSGSKRGIEVIYTPPNF